MRLLILIAVVLGVVGQAVAQEAVRMVRDDAGLAAALRGAAAGDVIRIAPGRYRGGLTLAASGTADRPIVIEAADADDPPVIEGGGNAIHLVGCSYVTLRNLHVRGQTGNGINCDDGGQRDRPARGIVLENLRVTEIGPRGNHDGLKLSGLSDFVVRGGSIEGWAGSGIDMVGCHNGLIDRVTFRGRDGFDPSNGIQAKGGSSNLLIRRCDFINAGHRAINCGGSTGPAYFRPPDATAEARDIRIEHCRFVGGDTPVAFVGVDGAVFERNTIYHPRRWLLRILQESTAERFVPCRNVRFERNLILFRAADIRTHVNIGPHTAPETFRFTDNAWSCTDRPGSSRPNLPVEETGGIHGRDFNIRLDGSGLPVATDPHYGAAPDE